MSLDLSGRTVVVTGAARGIGRSIADRLAAAGAKVVLWGRRQSAVAEAALDRGGGGVILQNASIAAGGVDGPYTHYSASKAGLLAVMRSMAVELAPFGIRVNAVSPGYTRTQMTTQNVTTEQAVSMSTSFARVPLRRLVEPSEVADAFVFLASDAASAITGTNLVVDGGLTANLYIMETLA